MGEGTGLFFFFFRLVGFREIAGTVETRITWISGVRDVDATLGQVLAKAKSFQATSNEVESS